MNQDLKILLSETKLVSSKGIEELIPKLSTDKELMTLYEHRYYLNDYISEKRLAHLILNNYNLNKDSAKKILKKYKYSELQIERMKLFPPKILIMNKLLNFVFALLLIIYMLGPICFVEYNLLGFFSESINIFLFLIASMIVFVFQGFLFIKISEKEKKKQRWVKWEYHSELTLPFFFKKTNKEYHQCLEQFFERYS